LATGGDPARNTNDVDEFEALSRNQLLELVRQQAQRLATTSTHPSKGAGNAANKKTKQN
jgi:hypothetical protein